jgi:hypothetical protein
MPTVERRGHLPQWREETVQSRRSSNERASSVRFAGWFGVLVGAACLAASGVLGVRAITQASEISAYRHAGACPVSAPADADCMRHVRGSVTAVTEFAGSGRVSADYALDVQTASTTLHITFTSDSQMLGYAVDGDPAIVTLWRGVPVSVLTDGRSEITASVTQTSLAHDLGNSEETGGAGMFVVLGALAIRRNRKAGGMQPLTRPGLAAALMALLLGSVVVAIGGIALDGKPDRLGPDLVAAGVALAAVLGLSVWAAISANRRTRSQQAEAARQGMAADVRNPRMPVLPANEPVLPTAPRVARARTDTPLKARLHPAAWARVLGSLAAAWLVPTLTVAVLFGVFFTSQDGPPARAFRRAPACVGETNLATCVGNFTAVVNGVRTPANGASFAGVSYVTRDGAINTWAQFDGNATAMARVAVVDENEHAPLRIRVWRRRSLARTLAAAGTGPTATRRAPRSRLRFWRSVSHRSCWACVYAFTAARGCRRTARACSSTMSDKRLWRPDLSCCSLSASCPAPCWP